VTDADHRPRHVSRADLRAGATVLGLVTVLGLPLGWLWSVLAPSEVVRRGPGGTATSLLSQSEHRFDALAVFVLLGLAAGVLTGAVVWLLRRRRGPVMPIAATVGALAAAVLARYTGQLLTTEQVVGELRAAGAAGTLVARAASIESWWATIAQPLGVALAYSTAASWNGHDQLHRWPART
jgi:hypothetical protein